MNWPGHLFEEVQLGNCNVHAEQKISVLNETKSYQNLVKTESFS